MRVRFGWVLVGVLQATSAWATLPVCDAPAADAITSITPAVYRASNAGQGLVVGGTARAGATRATVRLAGQVAGSVTLSGASTQQSWTMAIAASTVEALADGIVAASLEVRTASGSTVAGDGSSFEKNMVPPAPPSAFTASVSSNAVSLRWTNPADADLAAIRLLRSSSGPARSADDATNQVTVFEGRASSYTDAAPSTGTWTYTAFARDTAGNWSSGVSTTATVTGTTTTTTISVNEAFETCGTSLPAGWSSSGRWYCASGRIRGETRNGWAVRDDLAADVDVTARVVLTDTASGSGVVARFDGSRGYVARLVPGTGVELVRLGAAPVVLATARRTVATLTGYTVRLVAAGASPVHLEVRVDGSTVATYDDSSADRAQSGRAGLWSGTDARTQYDDFALTGTTGTCSGTCGGGTSTPPPPPSGTSFADTFDACTSTTDLGSAWTIEGRWYCASGRARGETALGLATPKVTLPPDVTVSGRVVLTGSASGSGVFARRSGTSYYAARLVAAGRSELVRVANGVETVLASKPLSSPTSSHTVTLTASGTSPVHLVMTVDGVTVGSVDDASGLGSGTCGLLSGSASRTQYDDFQAKSP